MSPDRDLLALLHRVLVGDGAMGTALQAAGLAPGGCPEAWNLERPEPVEAVSRSYREAGADLLTTNTFGGHPHKLAAYGLDARCAQINRAGAACARRAAGEGALVLGSFGPAGALLEPYGELSADDARRGFAAQAEALAEGGADALLVETMIDLAEATLAVRAAAATGLPVLATMTFDATPRGPYTVMGVDVPRAAAGLAEAGAAVVGTNCGTGPEPMVEIVAALSAEAGLPVLVQPNAGLPEVTGGEVRYPTGPEAFAAYVPAFVEAGAAIIGGCCGTTPDHVRALVAAVRAAEPGSPVGAGPT